MERDTIKVYGAKWCGDCFRVKMILDNYQIDYHWIDIDKDKGAKEFVRQVNNGNVIVPTIVFDDGSTLTEPTNQQLIQKLGLTAGTSA